MTQDRRKDEQPRPKLNRDWDDTEPLAGQVWQAPAAPAAGAELATSRDMAIARIVRDSICWVFDAAPQVQARIDDEYLAGIIAKRAPIATPSDAAPAQSPATPVGGLTAINTWQERTDECTPTAVVMAMESEIADLRAALARLSHPTGGEKAATFRNVTKVDRFADQSAKLTFTSARACSEFLRAADALIAQSPAPVTADPVAGIDTPEFRELLAKVWGAWHPKFNSKPLADLIAHIDRHIAAQAAAGRDAIIEECAQRVEQRAANIGPVELIGEACHETATNVIANVAAAVRALKLPQPSAANAQGGGK